MKNIVAIGDFSSVIEFIKTPIKKKLQNKIQYFILLKLSAKNKLPTIPKGRKRDLVHINRYFSMELNPRVFKAFSLKRASLA